MKNIRWVFAAIPVLFASCGATHWAVTQKNGDILPITADYGSQTELDSLIAPYKSYLDKEMAQVLTFAPKTYDKNGKISCSVGELFAHAAFESTHKAFALRYHKTLDGIFLNIGGVRSILPEGQVTMRNAFELMPFENSVCVVPMQKKDIENMVQFFIDDKKAHPVKGISFQYNAAKTGATAIWVNGQPLTDRTYYIATNDYLYNGGDRMTFFKAAGEKMELDYKLRNALIDYFQSVTELPTQFPNLVQP